MNSGPGNRLQHKRLSESNRHRSQPHATKFFGVPDQSSMNVQKIQRLLRQGSRVLPWNVGRPAPSRPAFYRSPGS